MVGVEHQESAGSSNWLIRSVKTSIDIARSFKVEDSGVVKVSDARLSCHSLQRFDLCRDCETFWRKGGKQSFAAL